MSLDMNDEEYTCGWWTFGAICEASIALKLTHREGRASTTTTTTKDLHLRDKKKCMSLPLLNFQKLVHKFLFLFVSSSQVALKHQKTKIFERMNSGRRNVVEKEIK